jgi:hypothetical protein
MRAFDFVPHPNKIYILKNKINQDNPDRQENVVA